ncbi:hypothetical protein DS906_05000 [Ruegeria sp. A3M17]|nr:hypothetical protein DS906_05000 [Ruegeria sp. A3M17]
MGTSGSFRDVFGGRLVQCYNESNDPTCGAINGSTYMRATNRISTFIREDYVCFGTVEFYSLVGAFNRLIFLGYTQMTLGLLATQSPF